MKKTILALTVFFLTVSAMGQNPAKDTVPTAIEVNGFLDSLMEKTTLKQFSDFLYSNVTQKNAVEGKYTDLVNLYIERQYTEWLQRRKKQK